MTQEQREHIATTIGKLDVAAAMLKMQQMGAVGVALDGQCEILQHLWMRTGMQTMTDELVLIEGKDGTWIERPKPYAIVECKTKEDYDMLMRLVERGRNSEWIDPAIELPADPKQLVLVLVSGRYNNITFKHAYGLANYIPGEGWILEQYPSWETPHISHWMLLSEMPEVMHEKL